MSNNYGSWRRHSNIGHGKIIFMEAKLTTLVFTTITNLGSGEISCALWSDYCPAVQKMGYSRKLFSDCMCSVNVSSVQGSGISYCVYIPCTPWLKPLFWWDTDVLVYSTVSILSPPWNDLTYLNNFDGTSYNITYKDDRKPISFGNCPCLSVGLHYYNLVLK